MMKAIVVDTPGDASHLRLGEAEHPLATPEQRRAIEDTKVPHLLVKIHATALNRADILQREGKYPPPPGDSHILGLEMAGVVEEVIGDGSGWKRGDRVCSLLGGGGYAEYALIRAAMAIKIPDSLSFEQAAALPEAFLTAYQALFWLAGIEKYESEHTDPKNKLNVLIHAGASGVGVALLQLLKRKKNNNTFVLVTAGSEDKIEFCKSVGADVGINYKTQNFSDEVLRLTNNVGAHVVIDFGGGGYWQKNLKALATDGTMVILALLCGGGIPAEENPDISLILRKRLTIKGSTLRARTQQYKEDLTRSLTKDCSHLITSSKESERSDEFNHIVPVIDKTFSWHDVQSAHRYMEENRNKGKIVLVID